MGRFARLRRVGMLAWLATLAFASTGCTRHFFRSRTDVEAEQVLREKDRFEDWKIEQFRVYPDPRARFADPTNPDRPPMPPDDPAAKMLAPNPQRPGKAGVERVEGAGYLDLLRHWDGENRSTRQMDPRTPDVAVQTDIRANPENRIAVAAPRRPDAPAQPYLLKLEQAVELGIINSREFQTRREDLYLAALPVTLERFSFAAQWASAGEAVLEHTGGNTSQGHGTRWRTGGDLGMAKLFSTGALLLVQYANSTVINLSHHNGSNRMTSFSTLNLDIIQPLLRGGGKAVTLEPLTQAERNLLYEIRQFARFRKEYYQYLSGGGDPVANGTPGGVGSAGLSIGGLSPASANTRLLVRPSSPARLSFDGGATAPSEGYFSTVLKQAQVGIEKRNLNRLDGILKLFQAYEEGGRVSSLQVGQTQLQILQAQNTYLSTERDARDALDRFKMQLGLPLDTPIALDDEVMKPILEQYDRYESLFAQFADVLTEVDKLDAMPLKVKALAASTRESLVKLLTESPLVLGTKKFREHFPQRWQAWQRNQIGDQELAVKLTDLRKERQRLLDEKDVREEKGETLPPADAEKLASIESELPLGKFEQALRMYESEPWKLQPTERSKREEQTARFRDVRNGFAETIGEASNERLALLRPLWPKLPDIRVCGQDIIDGDLETAYDLVVREAHEGRLDLMNSRAQVVDSWRQIAVHANALLGVFNVSYHADTTTPPNGTQPFDFNGTRSRHQLIMGMELPLVRKSERNAYRASQIAYQRARRALTATEDAIANQVRSEVRQLQVLAKSFKIQQQSVELAFLQVESSLETFKAPPAPGAGGDSAASAAALTQQLLGAYARLPREQAQLLNIWINYRIARQQLALDMEAMPLDFRGVWNDEFGLSDRPRPDLQP